MGGRPPPGSVFGRADNTEITGGWGRPRPRPSRTVVPGGRGQLLGLGTGVGEATDCKSCGKGGGRGRGFYCFLLTVLRKARRGWAWTGHPLPPSVPLGRWVLVKRMEPGLGRKVRGGSIGASTWSHPSARDASKCCTLRRAQLDPGREHGAGGHSEVAGGKTKVLMRDPAYSPPPVEDEGVHGSASILG